jgi:dihydroflavonol-4-reductase
LFNQWRYGTEYVLSKFISEQLVRGLIAQGLPAVIVNPGYPFGPGDRAPTPTGGLLISILKGELKQYFDGGISAVDVRDVAAGHVLAMEKGRIGESYLLANPVGNLSLKDFADLAGRVTGVDNVATQHVSSKMMAVVGRVMETWARISGKPPATTYNNSMYAMQNIWADPSKAINELGLPQTPIETAIEDAAKWFRENGYA